MVQTEGGKLYFKVFKAPHRPVERPTMAVCCKASTDQGQQWLSEVQQRAGAGGKLPHGDVWRRSSIGFPFCCPIDLRPQL